MLSDKCVEKQLEYRNDHYPGVFQFVIKSVNESIDNLYFFNMGSICTEANHTLYLQKGTISAVYLMYNLVSQHYIVWSYVFSFQIHITDLCL